MIQLTQQPKLVKNAQSEKVTIDLDNSGINLQQNTSKGSITLNNKSEGGDMNSQNSSENTSGEEE